MPVSLILIHNHPSGDPTPSPDDLQITVRIYQAGELLGIHLLDHIVIGIRDTAASEKKDYGIHVQNKATTKGQNSYLRKHME